MMPSRRALLVALAVSPFAAYAADPDAAAPIQALNQALIKSMQSGKATPFAQRYQALAPVLDRAFDLQTILRASIGPRWTQLPPAEQQQLLVTFRKFTVASYAANFDSYNGERIELVPGTRMVGADPVVQTQIVASGDTTPIDYVMQKGPAGWQAVDVLLNGSISQVAVNRSDWRSLLTSGAGGLIASLQRKVSDLSGGSIS